MPEITLDSVEKLDRFVKDANARLEEHEQKLAQLGDADGEGRKALEAQIKELARQMDEAQRRRLPVTVGEFKTPVSKREFVKLGVKAIHDAKTPVEKTGTTFKDPDGSVAEFQDAADALYAYRGITRCDREQLRESPIYKELYRPALERVLAQHKDSFDTADVGQGAEWIPNEFSSRLAEKVRLNERVAGLFPQIAMTRSPFNEPVQMGKMKAYYFTEQTATIPVQGSTEKLGDAVGSTTITGKVTYTGRAIGAVAYWSKFEEEDAIVSMPAFCNSEIAKAVADAIEYCDINGDRTATHQDADIEALGATDAATAWYGLRYHALASTAKKDAGGNKLDTSANLRDYFNGCRALMGVYGINPSDLAFIVSMNLYNQLLGIDWFATIANFGAGATIVNGSLGNLYGMPVIVSEYMKQDLAATGVNTAGGPNSYTGGLIVNRGTWKHAVVRNMTITPLRETLVLHDSAGVAVTWRGDFQPIFGSTTDVGYIYDIGQ